jgi:hypothetical protein
MKKIGNILTKNKFFDTTWCNVTDKAENLISNLPTLVVGLDNAKNFDENFSILDWKLRDNVYWTFGPREQRHIYEKRVDDFLQLCLIFQKSTINYEFFNVLTEDKESKRELLCKITNSNNCKCFLCNDMLYICIDEENTITGISLRDIDYSGMDKNRFLSQLKTRNNVKFYTNQYNFPQAVRMFLRNSIYVSAKLCE